MNPVTVQDCHSDEVAALTADFTAAISDLTERERQVVLRLARCDSNRAIARSLLITERTVKAHLSSVMAKLGVSSRVEVAVVALRHHDLLCRCAAGRGRVPRSNTGTHPGLAGWATHPISCEKG
ncbi:response regulator transcription factor [Streptomyces sp. SYSU K217416]